ncbi:MAG TPA: hypothetical protein PKA37_17500 [Planctomycetota bacterium]|nr:hypothetical protein [Planctomycetota bacterium]
MMRISLLILLVLSCLSSEGFAQKPTHDPKAVALLKRAFDLEYSARRAGLSKASYEHSLSQFPGVAIQVEWSAAKGVTSTFVFPEEISEQVRSRLSGALASAVKSAADLVLGKAGMEAFAQQSVELLSEDRVLIRKPRRDAEAAEETTTMAFGKTGLPEWVEFRGPDGMARLALSYLSKGGQNFLHTVKSEHGAVSMVMTLSWQEVGAFHVLSEVVTESGSTRSTQKFGKFELKGEESRTEPAKTPKIRAP